MKVRALANLSGGAHGDQPKGSEFTVSATLGQDLVSRNLAEEVATEIAEDKPARKAKAKE
jgi:hypothetical protein